MNDSSRKPQPKATSFDVARRAGVSRTTVSFVLNDTPDTRISQGTRDRVLQAARDLDYVPDASARTLRLGRTRTLGLYVRHASVLGTDWFTAQLIERLIRASAEYQYRLLIQAASTTDCHFACVHLLRSHQIDGLIVLDPDYRNAELQAILQETRPVVVVGVVPDRNISSVRSDDRFAMQEIVHHLISRDRYRYNYLHYEPMRATDGRDRYRALELAVADVGEHRVQIELGGFANFTAESGYEAMQRILAGTSSLPDAYLVGNDSVAIGALAALHDAGVRIPTDVAVTGFDDRPEAKFLNPPLTTFHQPLEQMATEAIRQAISLIDDFASGPHYFRGRGQLVVRSST